MLAVEYETGDGETFIRRCPPLASVVGNKSDFWYIHRQLWPDKDWRWMWRAGFRTLYWDGEKWWHITPKQFETAEDAYREWEEKIKTTN